MSGTTVDLLIGDEASNLPDAFFFPLGNRKRKYKNNTRHFYVTCPYCDKRKKNITLHFKNYHSAELWRMNQSTRNALRKGSVGVLTGIRFIKTSEVSHV